MANPARPSAIDSACESAVDEEVFIGEKRILAKYLRPDHLTIEFMFEVIMRDRCNSNRRV
jgi:hypothetical protein